MPTLNELPGQIKRKNLIKALGKLGFEISRKGGKGSHIKATHRKSQKSITLPEKIEKHVLYYCLKEIENISGLSWNDIKEKL